MYMIVSHVVLQKVFIIAFSFAFFFSLAGGKPPAMPVFDGWRDCFSYLKKNGELQLKIVMKHVKYIFYVAVSSSADLVCGINITQLLVEQGVPTRF